MLRVAAAGLLFAGGAALYVAAVRKQAAYTGGAVDYGSTPEGAMVEPPEWTDPLEAPSIADAAADVLSGAVFGAVDRVSGVDEVQAQRNEAAFLAMIRAAEGTSGAGGYGALFGWPAAGRSFRAETAFDHPRQFFAFTDKAGRRLRTSAAGAYQVTVTTWDDPATGRRIRTARGIAGFTPADQDSFAVGLLELDGALAHVRAGRLDAALRIARRRWASLPGAGYAQPERSSRFVLDAYTGAGGQVVA
jgi:muramidase (phage lysozyme)